MSNENDGLSTPINAREEDEWKRNAFDFEREARKAGWTGADLARASQDPEMLRKLLALVHGGAEAKPSSRVVDCDAAPFVPDGWSVESHRKGGLVDLAKVKVTLFLTKRQEKGAVAGNQLRKDLADEPVLNANALDFFYLAHPELIPDEWKGKAVFFWGTIYRNRGGSLCVRCLCWRGGRWGWHGSWLGCDWDSDCPAACGQASA